MRRKIIWPIRRYSGFFAVLLILVFSGCGQERSINNPVTLSTMQLRFVGGQASMACGLACSGEYGRNRRNLQQLYRAQDWNGLETKLLTIGNDNDQAWFYLASAAEGLGYDEAAQTYYFKSLTARYRCNGLLNVCDGLMLPDLTFDHLTSLDEKIAQSPQFVQLYAPPANPTEIQLFRSSGLLLAPALIDGQIPVFLAVGSGPLAANIPEGVTKMLAHAGLLPKSGIIGNAAVSLGNGTVVHITDFHIESLQIGNVVFPNVTGTVSPDLDKLIIGQDLFSHLKSWSINNAQGVLVLQQ